MSMILRQNGTGLNCKPEVQQLEKYKIREWQWLCVENVGHRMLKKRMIMAFLLVAIRIPESQEQYQGVDPDNHRSAPTEISSHKDAYEWQELLACPCVRPSEWSIGPQVQCSIPYS